MAKAGIHPNYSLATITCACGATYETASTRGSFTVEICARCHPFYTGRQKLLDTAGRIDRFNKRYQLKSGATLTAAVTAKDEADKAKRAEKVAAEKAAKAEKPEKAEKPPKAPKAEAAPQAQADAPKAEAPKADAGAAKGGDKGGKPKAKA